MMVQCVITGSNGSTIGGWDRRENGGLTLVALFFALDLERLLRPTHFPHMLTASISPFSCVLLLPLPDGPCPVTVPSPCTRLYKQNIGPIFTQCPGEVQSPAFLPANDYNDWVCGAACYCSHWERRREESWVRLSPVDFLSGA